MTRTTGLAIASSLAVLALITSVVAQPPGPPPGQPGGPPLPEHRDPLRRALDTNGDHELDKDEIAKAAESLAKLDTDSDGRISREELFPRPPEFQPRGPGERERAGPPGQFGGFRGPPREGETGPPPPPPGESREGPPPRGGEGFRPPGAPPGEGPSPERFVERAMSFDGDGDGKLDKAELGKFAEAMMGRMRPGGEGFRREPPPRPGPVAPGGDAGRGERPRRPEGEGRPERPRRPFGEEDRPAPPGDGERPAPPAGDAPSKDSI